MVSPVPPEMIVAQVRAVADDIGVDAVKVGMLADEPTIDAVVEALDLVGDAPVVVDPVMVSESGAVLLDPNAKAALIERVLPLATVVTPNLPEARELAGPGRGCRPGGARARRCRRSGRAAVIVTGGHADDGADVLFDGVRDAARSTARGTRTARRTGRAARTPRRSPPSSRAAPSSPTRPAGRARSPPRRSATACASSAPGPAPSTSSASRGSRRAVAGRPETIRCARRGTGIIWP